MNPKNRKWYDSSPKHKPAPNNFSEKSNSGFIGAVLEIGQSHKIIHGSKRDSG